MAGRTNGAATAVAAEYFRNSRRRMNILPWALNALLPELWSPVFSGCKHDIAIESCCIEQGFPATCPTVRERTKKDADGQRLNAGCTTPCPPRGAHGLTTPALILRWLPKPAT